MNVVFKGWFVITVAILQYEFWIILAQETPKESSIKKEDIHLPEAHEPKKTHDASSASHVISLSPREETIIFPSSHMSFSVSNSLSSPIVNTPSLPSEELFHSSNYHFEMSSSITDLIIEETSTHFELPESSPVILSSYLIDQSSYLLEDSFISYNSNYLFESSLKTNSVAQNSEISHLSEGESRLLTSDEFDAPKSTSTIESSDLNTLLPYADSRIHVLSSRLNSLSSTFLAGESEVSSESGPDVGDLNFSEYTTATVTTVESKSDVTKFSDLVENSPLNSDIIVSSLIEERRIAIGEYFTSTAGSSKTTTLTEIAPSTKENASNTDIRRYEIEDVDNRSSKTDLDDDFELLSESKSESSGISNVSHEIINDVPILRNKTSRNEDPQLGNIISGIVHLLSGNVQLAALPRPPFQSPPRRQLAPHGFHSTRINNRGPISSSSASRTIVVFSQPQNPANFVTEIPRPVQFVPLNPSGAMVNRPPEKTRPAVRVHPTKHNEKIPPGVSAIQFHRPAAMPPHNRHTSPPFIGEIFSHNNGPPVPKVQASIPTQFHKVKSETSYPHFIFSDGSGSSVVVVLSSLPSKVPPVGTLPPSPEKTNYATQIAPTKTFEVLGDTMNHQKPMRSENPSIPNTVKPSGYSIPKNNISRDSIRPTSIRNPVPTPDNDTVPFGPITDWVAVFERPSMKFKPYPNKTRTDNDVSIIMQPIIFDITVSNSLNKVKVSETTTGGAAQSISSPSSPHKEFTTSDLIQPSSTETAISSNTVPTPKLEISKSKDSDHNNLKSSPTNVLITESDQMTEHSTYSENSNENNTFFSRRPPLELSSSSITIPDIRSYTLQKVASSISSTQAEETVSISSFPTEEKTLTYNIPAEEKSPIFSIPAEIKSSESNSPVEEKSSVPKTYTKASSTNSASSRSYATVHSTYSNTHPPLGRPIVIPVDIEEVRPFVGAINPVNQDRPRGVYPSHQAPFPGPPVQVTRAGVNIKDEYSNSLSPSPFQPSRTPIIRSPPRSRPNTIRIDTCIVGDDSTCDVKVNETCKTEHGISSCHCRPGYARFYTRGPCIPVVSLMLSIKIDRLGNKKITFSPKYMDKNSEEYRIMEFEAKQALTSLFSQTAFSRTFLGMNVNMFYSIGGKLILNSTVYLEEKESTRAQSVRLRLRQEVGEAIKNKNQNIGESRLYVEGPLSPLTNIEDVNECSDPNLNDCASDGTCLNVFGTFLCKCRPGYVDPFLHDERKSGRKCLACSPEYCTYHGQCFVEREQKLCKCQGNYIGSRCEIDGEVLGVALGASLAAIIIILLTLSCLCIWNRKWKKQQQKAEVLSARSYNSNQTFSYLSNMMNANANANAYQLTMEDRMRWSHISDVVKSASVANPELAYASTTLEPASYPSRYQHPSDEEVSWYDYRTRPRSRMLSHPGTSPNATYYEMDSPSRGPYMASTCHSTKRYKNTNAMMRY